MPDPASEQGEHIFTLWRWAWVAALITGGIVWGLIFWAMWRYHRTDSDDEIPVQTRYNLPLEIFYTIAPVIMVIVFFVHTVDTQNTVLDDEGAARPHHLRRRPAVVVDLQLRRRADAVDVARTSARPAPRPTSRRSCCRSARPPSSSCTRPT